MHTHPARALAVCSPGHGRLHLFVGAEDDTVRHQAFDGGWHPWRTLDRPWPAPGTPGATGAPGFNWLSATAMLADDGEVYCFEVNPCPAFTYYESHTGQPIARAVARALARG
ncbi:hypothetical protein ACIQWA_29930 [Kitasatospora sp. NPDC098652]|uniref:hypothetical protein n=1 Tax=Kitasatospora sp. NPDC098652 TaxID=3364095 RepID=UPI0038169FA6